MIVYDRVTSSYQRSLQEVPVSLPLTLPLPIDIITSWLAGLSASRDPLQADTGLIEKGILDSIEILNLVAFLEEEFAVTLPIDSFVPENFATPRTVAALVDRLRAG